MTDLKNGIIKQSTWLEFTMLHRINKTSIIWE